MKRFYFHAASFNSDRGVYLKYNLVNITRYGEV